MRRRREKKKAWCSFYTARLTECVTLKLNVPLEKLLGRFIKKISNKVQRSRGEENKTSRFISTVALAYIAGNNTQEELSLNT